MARRLDPARAICERRGTDKRENTVREAGQRRERVRRGVVRGRREEGGREKRQEG